MGSQMNFNSNEDVVKKIVELYNLNIGLSDKINQFYEFCPKLKEHNYYGDIVTIFENPLPIVKGVQLTTSQVDSLTEHEKTLIIQMPEKEALSTKVQMAWMRIMGFHGKFELQTWFTSKQATRLTPGQENLWKIYLGELSDIKCAEYNSLLEEQRHTCGYWVYPIEYGMIINEPNETREWNEAVGIILGEYIKNDRCIL